MRITSRGVLAREREAGRSWRKGRLGIPAVSPPTAPCPLRTGCCVPLISPQHPASWAAQGLGHPGDPGDPSSARPCLRGFHFRLAVGGLGPQREARTVGLHCGLSLVGYRPCHWRQLQRQPAWESGSLGYPRRQLPSSTLKFATRPQSGAQPPAIQDAHFILPLWSHARAPQTPALCHHRIWCSSRKEGNRGHRNGSKGSSARQRCMAPPFSIPAFLTWAPLLPITHLVRIPVTRGALAAGPGRPIH